MLNMQLIEKSFDSKSEFDYGFYIDVYRSNLIRQNVWGVVHCNNTSDNVVCYVYERDNVLFEYESNAECLLCMQQDFDKFKNRPEFSVKLYNDSSCDLREENDCNRVQEYNNLLLGCFFHRYQNIDDEKLVIKADKMIKWLESTDFYTAPASSRYHDSNEGGLVQHSLNVVEKIKQLLAVTDFSHVDIYSAILCALVHDWCKIGYYEQYNRNVKDDVSGTWSQVQSYRTKETSYVCFGHGASSMFLASKFFKLTVEEAEAIRWHMGEYNVAYNEMNELHQANKYNPLCYLLQFADRLACTNY